MHLRIYPICQIRDTNRVCCSVEVSNIRLFTCLLCCLEAYMLVLFTICNTVQIQAFRVKRNTTTSQRNLSLCECVCSHVQTSGWRQQWKNYGSCYTRVYLHIEKIAQQYTTVHAH